MDHNKVSSRGAFRIEIATGVETFGAGFSLVASVYEPSWSKVGDAKQAAQLSWTFQRAYVCIAKRTNSSCISG